MTVCNQEQDDSPNLRFWVPQNAFSFHHQYSSIYNARLTEARPVLTHLAKTKWISNKSKLSIISLADMKIGEKCIIIGTLFKETNLKPSILRDIALMETMNSNQPNQPDSMDCNTLIRLTTEGDVVYLEDEVQRIGLKFSDDYNNKGCLSLNVVTGIVAAFLGYESEDERGVFQVEDYSFMEPQPNHPIESISLDCELTSDWKTTGPWLAVVSGLGFVGSGSIRSSHSMALQLLADWLRCMGDFSGSKTDEPGPNGVIRLIILGDSIQSGSGRDGEHGPTVRRARYLTRNANADSVVAMKHFDQWLASLPIGPGYVAANSQYNGLSVDILPGPSDPTSLLMPQQPVHPLAFPHTIANAACNEFTKRRGVCGRTNPYFYPLLNGRSILATSGQGVNDVFRYSFIETSCARMESTLLWGHLAPTCPDTLSGYPVLDRDPLLMSFDAVAKDKTGYNQCSDYPDIYLAGCQPGLEPDWKRARLRWNDNDSSVNKGALVVAVPRFDISCCLVLVHLKSLVCQAIHFDLNMLDEKV